MANPITILVEQAGQPAGTPGVSRDDLIVGALCTVTDPANFAGGGTWDWSLVVPNGSSTTGAGETTNTFTFTPDIPGTYLIYLAYDDGTEVLSYVVDVVGQLITDQGGAGVKDTHSHRYIGFGETQQFGLRGWDPAVDAILRNTSALLTAPVSHASSHDAGGGDALAIDAAAATGSLRTLGTGAAQAAAGDDSRLSDARTPTAHASSHDAGGGDAMAIDAAAATGSLRTLGTGAAQAAAGNDSRLSDARTPTSHASSHDAGGGDAMAIDAAAGTGSLRTLGTAATVACAGDDSRLSDARTPTSHAASHLNAGADTLAADVVKTTSGPTDMVVGAVADGEYLKRVGATIVGGTPSGGTTAAALATASDDVDVISALAPTTGQVLKATDATHATWQTVPTGFGAATEKLINTLRAGDTASHDSAAPQIVSQFAFNPAEYSLTGCTRSLVFRAAAANGGGVAQTKARLYSVSDAEYIGTGLTFTSSTVAKMEETLTIGSGVGEVDDAEKIYEVHIWVVSPGAGDTIELGSAELRLINTIN